MFGIQWDLTCKFFFFFGGLSQAEIKRGDEVGSTNWGNYQNSSIILSRGKYNTSPYTSTSQWLDITTKTKNGIILLTTGASEDTNKMNIYDLAGNVNEWTLETYTSDTRTPCTDRGGNYSLYGSYRPVSSRYYNSTTGGYNDLGFRPSLY